MAYKRKLKKFVRILKDAGVDSTPFRTLRINEDTSLPGEGVLDYTASIKTQSHYLQTEGNCPLVAELTFWTTAHIPEKLDNNDKRKRILDPHFSSLFYTGIGYDSDELGEEWSLATKKYKEDSQLIIKIDKHLDLFPNGGERKLVVYPAEQKSITWTELFTEAIYQGNLRWFNREGQDFPYVLVNQSVINNLGRSVRGLYFVAKELAVEPWKELVVAYHERFCQAKSHECACEKEKELAQKLGMGKEHLAWREGVRLDVENGKFN